MSRSRTPRSSASSRAARREYFSAVLGKGSTLTPCVDAAINSLTADGTLDKLASTWLPFQDSVPVIKP